MNKVGRKALLPPPPPEAPTPEPPAPQPPAPQPPAPQPVPPPRTATASLPPAHPRSPAPQPPPQQPRTAGPQNRGRKAAAPHPGVDDPTEQLPAVGPPAAKPPAVESPAVGSPAAASSASAFSAPASSVPPSEPGPDPRSPEGHEVGPKAVGTDGLSRLALSKRRRRRKMKIAGRTFVAVVSVLALLGTGAIWGYVRSTEAGFAQIAALDTESTDIVDPVGQTGDETYLIIGTDTRAGASGAIGAGTVADAEGARADTVILVNIPADRSRVVAVSFPRDLDVERPVCRGWDSTTGDYSSELFPAADGDKLNATYALGGPKCLVKVIQKMSGMKIGHFVGVDFAGFESMVEEIGGVEVCTPTPLIDGELGALIDTPGTHVLDGRRALDYVRARKVESEGNGDYGRITRQQKFLSSLLRSALSNRVLFDPGKLNGFINAFTRATFVENVNTESLVKLGRSLQNVDAGAVTFLTVPTAGTNDWGNEIPRLDDIEAIFTAIIDDLPLPGEKRQVPDSSEPAKTPAAAPVDTLPSLVAVEPSTVAVQVSNASGVSGLAARVAESVGAYGFAVYAVGNYSGNSTQTVIRFAPGQEAEAATVASAFPGAVLQETAGADLGSIIEIVLGSNFDETVAYPTPAGTVLEPVEVVSATADSVTLPTDLSITNAGDDLCS
ncbi:LCP family protein [Rhodococcus chondri]